MKNYFLLVLLSFTLTACAKPAQDPKAVADRYWQSVHSGDISTAEKLLSTDSRHALPVHSKRLSTVTSVENGEAETVVSTTITSASPDTDYPQLQTFDTVLVLEHGQWKVDATRSKIPDSLSMKQEELDQLKEKLNESMQENMQSLDEAMNQGMQMLNEALKEGSEEMGSSLLNLMDQLNSTMQESIEKMKQRRQQQLQEQQDQQPQQQTPPEQETTEPDPGKGEGMI